MKHLLVVIIATFLLGFLTPRAFATTSVDIENNGEGASSDVHVENSVGESTVCINGKCETKQNGENTTTVCINGNCETTQNGNIEKQEGGAKVKVETPRRPAEQDSERQGNEQSITPTPTSTPTPTPQQEASISAAQEDPETRHVDLGQIIRNFGRFVVSLIL